MIYWAQLFHFYQPPTQIPTVLEKICSESYNPLLDVFRQNPHARATININGILMEMLHNCGHREVLEGLISLYNEGQIELTGSGKYHPILPLIPDGERKRQIELNLATIRRFIGKEYTPKGFFPPEMCYSRDILKEVVDSGHNWIILSGIACPNSWPVNKIYQVEHEGRKLSVFFRDDILSNKISFKQIEAGDFLQHLKLSHNGNGDIYVITAMDAETYGHHIQGWEQLFLAAVYEQLGTEMVTYAGIKQATELATQQTALLDSSEFSQTVKPVTISELLEIFPAGETVEPKPSSWSSSADDIEAGVPFPLWLDNGNEIHRLQWEHLALAIEVVKKAHECADTEECTRFGHISRGLLDMAEHSCQFWWASRRPMWDINLIHLGLIDQWRAIVNAYRSITRSNVSEDIKREYYYKVVAARDIRSKITDRLFIL